jgi:integrase
MRYMDERNPKVRRKAAMTPRRPRGTGTLMVRKDSAGRETWYGKWRVGTAQVKRRIGPKRTPSTRDGLTRSQAEAELRKLIGSVQVAQARRERMTITEAGELLVESATARGLKRSTVMSYETICRIHLVPFFKSRRLDQITRRDVENLAAHMIRQGKSPATARHTLSVLHSIFEHARRQEWIVSNPASLADKPRAPQVDPDIRFLENEEVEALVRSVPDDYLGRIERPLYLTATMTGMRQGELLALRWRDVDWQAQRVRIRRNFVRGEFGTPKSKRSSRSVPLADRLAGELDRLHRETNWPRDDDLVFAHPHTGKPIDRSKLLKRFKAALRRGSLRDVRFHDLRHTFGTRLAAQGVPMRTLQEMLGHRDFKTTLIYADYAPNAHEAGWIEAVFAPQTKDLAADEQAAMGRSE